MKTLIFYAHPDTQGHCSTILARTEKVLAQKGIEYEKFDLYKTGYDPVLHENEHFTAGNRDISPGNVSIQEKISASEKMIFIYPLWWATMPAVLKGFFDKVLTPRFAYRYEGMIPRKLLKEKRALVFITSGSPLWYLWLTGNRPKKLIKKDILGFCGIKAKIVQIGSCRKWKEEKIPKLNNITEAALENFLN